MAMGADYVDKAQLQAAIKEWGDRRDAAKTAGVEIPPISCCIAQSVILICKGTVSRPNFNGYPFVEEMQQDAVFACIKAIHGYDVTHPKQNPFGYLSRVAWNACVERLNIEKRHRDAIQELILDENSDHFTIMNSDDVGLSKAEICQYVLFN